MGGLRWTTSGESHGPALVAVLEGLPSGFALDVERIDAELARRQRGYGRGGRMRIERDTVRVLSGTRGGLTLGSPLTLLLENRDATIERLPVPTNPRPGHADLAGCQKHGHRDPRAVLERASARETAARVALGAAARQLLETFGVDVLGHVVALGGEEVVAPPAPDSPGLPGLPGSLGSLGSLGSPEAPGTELRARRDASEFHSLDPDADVRFRAAVDAAKAEGDTLGGVFEVRTTGLPPGLGDYADPRERLTSRLGAALLSIPAMKGVEFGLGFESARRRGSQVHDPIVVADPPGVFGRFARSSNRAGGLEGGMTTGEPLVARVAMKPIATLRRGVPTVDFETGAAVSATYQRSDVTAVPAAAIVGEAVVALVLASALLEKLGGSSMAEVTRAFGAWVEDLNAL